MDHTGQQILGRPVRQPGAAGLQQRHNGFLGKLRQQIERQRQPIAAGGDSPGDLKNGGPADAGFGKLNLSLGDSQNAAAPQHRHPAIGPDAFETSGKGPLGAKLHQRRMERRGLMAQGAQQVIPQGGAAQLGPRRAAGGKNQLVPCRFAAVPFQKEAVPALPDFPHLTARMDFHTGLFQRKAQHVQNAVGLV